MRILHTSDWHLGKKLERFSRIEEQKAVMSEICDLADSYKVDAILIAGDIFDNFNPAVEAVELFYQTLRKLSNQGNRAVVVIAGNHDSADRIEAPEPLARELGIVLMGFPDSKAKLFELESGLSLIKSDSGFLEFKLPNSELLRLILTPYASQQRIKQFLGVDDSEQQLREVLGKSWQQTAATYCDKKGVNLLVSHLFFCKKSQGENKEKLIEPEDEKPILHIGGAQAIYSDAVPKQVQYAALGHLHRKQIVDTTNAPLVYCGSPIAYSFSEHNQTKYIVIADITAGEKANIDFIELQQGKKLLRKTVKTIDAAQSWLKDNPDALVEITLEMDNYLKVDEKKSLYDLHSGIVNIIPTVNQQQINNQMAAQSINLNDDLNSLFKQYFASRHSGQQANQELIDLFSEVISELVDSPEPDKLESS